MTTPAPPPLSRDEQRAVDAIIARAARLSIAARRQLWRLFSRQEMTYARRAAARARKRQQTQHWATQLDSSPSGRAGE